MSATELRWGEMAALKVGSLDMSQRRISITEAYAEVSGKLVLDTAKNHERRSVPFPAFLSDPLTQLMTRKAVDDLVFTGPKGAALRVNTFRRRPLPGCRSPLPHHHPPRSSALGRVTGENARSRGQRQAGSDDARPQIRSYDTDGYADLFPDDLDAVAIALAHETKKSQHPDHGHWLSAWETMNLNGAAGNRTPDIFEANDDQPDSDRHKPRANGR